MFSKARHVREQREILERHADAAVLRIDARHVLAVDQDGAVVGVVHAGDEAQQHRLAGRPTGRSTTIVSLSAAASETCSSTVCDLERLDVTVSRSSVAMLRHPFTAPSDRPSTR